MHSVIIGRISGRHERTENQQYMLCVSWIAVVFFIIQVAGKELQFSGYLHRAGGGVRTGE